MRTLPDARDAALRKDDPARDPKRRRRRQRKLSGLPFQGFTRPGWVRLYTTKGFANAA